MESRGTGTLRPRQRSIRRYSFLTLLLIAVAAPAGFVLAGERSEPYIVVFKEDAVDSLTAQAATTLLRSSATNASAQTRTNARRVDGAKVRRHVIEIEARTRVRATNVYANAVGGFSAVLNSSQVRSLLRDPAVAAVVPDEAIALDEGPAGTAGSGIRTTASPRVGIPAGIRRVGAQRSTVSHFKGGDSRVNVDVAIIDTGIQRNHPDLNVVGGYNCTGRNRNAWDDDDGHGTHVAGIVGAIDNRIGVVGVAPGARLWAVKVLDGNGSGMLSWMVCGIDWVTAQRENGNASQPLIEVANMSISFGLARREHDCGRGDADAMHEAICRSVAKGTVYVVAAGNEAHNASRNRPAAFDEVITVSALADYDGRGGGRGVASDSCPYWSPERDDSFTDFSNFGSDVDLIAPGRCILSTYPQNRYAWMSGTSMATPHVTGAAAVYRAAYPRATPQQVRMALQAVGTRDWRTDTDPDGDHEKAVWIGEFRTMPDFTLAAASTPATAARPGTRLDVSVAVERIGGFEDPVTVELVDPPSGFSATPVRTPGTSAVLDIAVGSSLRPGSYTLTVRGLSTDIERTTTLSLTVDGAPPTTPTPPPTGTATAFTSPAPTMSFNSTSSVTVAWSEAGSTQVSARALTRQSGRIKTPGYCDDVRWTADYTRTRTSPVTERTASGFCYRWSLAAVDAAGHRTSVVSGPVLVDTTPPRAPSVGLAEPGKTAFDLTALGVDAAYLGHSGMLWVRGGATGSVDLDVSGYDPESGVASNTAVVDSRAGWRATWAGDPASSWLKVTFADNARESEIHISTVNGAGLTSAPTVGQLIPDSTVPTTVEWTSVPTDAVLPTTSTSAFLDWTGGQDAGSGLADSHWVVRYRAVVNARGKCRTADFRLDGSPQLRQSGTIDRDLQAGYCYAWGVRTLDNVGNASPVAWSGWVVVEGRPR
jgi:subtilisin